MSALTARDLPLWRDALGLASDLLFDEKLGAELQGAVHSHPDEEAARRLQIARVAACLNAVAGAADGARRLYAFAEDIPGWEAHEPVWLLLTADERARLLALGIVRPLASGADE